MAQRIRVNDVSQIDPEFHEQFGGHLFVRQRINNRTAFGYLSVPGHGLIAFRVPVACLRRTGEVVWVGEPDGDKPKWRQIEPRRREVPK